MYICKYFRLQELVSPLVFEKYGQFAWYFFDSEFLEDIDTLREAWGKPLIINNWHNGGHYKESGLRCNRDNIVKNKTQPYLSGHVLGRAVDIKPLKIADVSNLYLTVIDNFKNFKKLSRLEDIKKAPTWVHVDCLTERKSQFIIF